MNKSKKRTNPFIDTKSISTYKTNISPDIDYDMFTTYMCLTSHCSKAYSLLEKEENSPQACLDMLNKNVYPNIIQPDADIKQYRSLKQSDRVYFMIYLKRQELTNVLVISPSFTIIDSLMEIGVNSHLHYLDNNELSAETETKYLSKLPVPYTKFSIETLYKNLPTKPMYDNIIIKINQFFGGLYLPVFFLTKFPSFLLETIRGLLEIRPGGNMYLFTVVSVMHPAMEWLIMILANLFESMSIVRNPMAILYNDSDYMIECRRFKKELTPKHYEIFISILSNKNIPKYNYSVCEFMSYYSRQVKPEKHNIPPLLKAKTKKRGKADLKILDDIKIDMDMKHNSTSYSILYQLKHIYTSHIDEINYTIKKYITREGDKIKVDSSYVDKITYLRMKDVISYFEEHKIPYNKSYKAYIDTYNTNLLNQIFTYTTPKQYIFVKYKKGVPAQPSIAKLPAYSIPELEELNKESMMSYVVKKNLYANLTRIPHVVKQITDDFARGVSNYINDHWPRLKHPVTNAFCKFWELVSMHPWLMPTREPRIFYVAEAPGQWIHSSHHYAKKQGKTIDWIATSLNPSHPENFSKGGFQDEYGFIRSNKDRWIWGADNTGDITHVANLRWYREYVHKRGKPLHLITSDAGMDVFDVDVDPTIIQKLELAQAMMVLGCASPGTHCCIKHFLPYMRGIPVTNMANGFFLNLIYLYVIAFEEVHIVKPLTSSKKTNEFYLLGKKFIGFPEAQFESLLDVMENFEVNTCFIREADIPAPFVKQLTEFMKDMTHAQIDIDETISLLLTCMIKKDPVIEKRTQCSKVLKAENIKERQDARFKAWITEHRFDA